MSLGPRPRLTLELTAAAAALLLGTTAHAQTAAANVSLERAQKQTDAVFHWIKLNGDKGANRQPPAPAPAPRKPAPVAAAPKPTAAPAASNAPAAAEAPTPVATAAAPGSQDSARAPLASATPPPDAPLVLAATAVQPPPPPPEEEVPLHLLSRVNPTIPRQMQKERFRDAYASVKFTVAPDGSVSNAESIKASHARLASAAIDAVKQWRFAPIPAAREAAIEFGFNNLDE